MTAASGWQLVRLLGLPGPDHVEMRSEFKHRFLGLALEAFRRDEISRGKLRELAAMVGLVRSTRKLTPGDTSPRASR